MNIKSVFIFPKPTGQYTVGTKLFELTDTAHNDPETHKPRELVVQVWYPAEKRAGQIEHWARIDRIAEENPDLTYEFIKNILTAQQEAQSGKLESYSIKTRTNNLKK